MTRKQGINFAVGLGLLVLVSLPPLELLRTDLPRLYPSPQNAWFGPVLLMLLGGFAAASVILLLRGISLAYCAWAQSVISVLVFFTWYGFLRREDSFRHFQNFPDPDEIDRVAPMATWSGVLLLALAGVIIGFLPLALRAVLRWRKARGKPSAPAAEVAPGVDGSSGIPPNAA